MEIVDRKPTPIYELVCQECGSKIRYKAAEVAWCHIICPVCGVALWANTICPVAMDEGGDASERKGGADDAAD